MTIPSFLVPLLGSLSTGRRCVIYFCDSTEGRKNGKTYDGTWQYWILTNDTGRTWNIIWLFVPYWHRDASTEGTKMLASLHFPLSPSVPTEHQPAHSSNNATVWREKGGSYTCLSRKRSPSKSARLSKQFINSGTYREGGEAHTRTHKGTHTYTHSLH